jgi:hypothetical protein
VPAAAFADYAARALPDRQSCRRLICWIANGLVICAVSYWLLRNIPTALIESTTSEQDSFNHRKTHKAILSGSVV